MVQEGQAAAQNQGEGKAQDPLRLYLNTLNSDYTRKGYKVFLDRYLQIMGYKDLGELLAKQPKDLENEIIEFIISLKERGSKFSTIINYVKPVLGLIRCSDIVLNVSKINRFIPPYVRNKKTRAYFVPEIQAMLDIATERERCAILLLSSAGLRINCLCGLTIGSLTPVGDIYRICCYENEPEEYVTYCSSEAKKSVLTYLSMRARYFENIENKSHPLIREQFDRRDPFKAAHPRPVNARLLIVKLTELAEAAGIRTRTQLESGQKGPSQRKEVPITNGYRRYFSTTLVNAGVKAEHRYLLEGHNLKFNDMSYVHITPEDLYQSYMLAHDDLLIDQSHKLREKIKTLQISANSIDLLAKKLSDLEATVNEGKGKN